MRSTTTRALTVLGLAGLAALAWPREGERPAQPRGTPRVSGGGAGDGEPAAPPHDRSAASFELPDGRRLPALNGVADAAGLAWPASVSSTPVVGIRRGGAWDAYVHEDGSLSSTIPVRDIRTGETEASAVVVRPIGVGGRAPVRVALPIRPNRPLTRSR